jgi:chromosomal replication initiation ATPase DnaA
MSVKEIKDNGTAIFVCPKCQAEFVSEYSESDDPEIASIEKRAFEKMLCPDCTRKDDEEAQVHENAEHGAELEHTLNERISKTGIPPRFCGLDKPYVRHAAEWLYRNKEHSVLVSGETGTGKTSSAGFIVRLMMKQRHMSVRYCTRQTLFADYVRAKTTDGDNESLFLQRLNKLDLLIIDEMVGKKGDEKLSPSAQELFFNIIDGVYNWSRATKVWILGNFYKGAIENLVDDPKPLVRRLNDSFHFAWFDEDMVDETIRLE